MDKQTFHDLIQRYIEKADYHGYEALLGDKKYRAWNTKEEMKYNRMIIEVVKLYLEEPYEQNN